MSTCTDCRGIGNVRTEDPSEFVLLPCPTCSSTGCQHVASVKRDRHCSVCEQDSNCLACKQAEPMPKPTEDESVFEPTPKVVVRREVTLSAETDVFTTSCDVEQIDLEEGQSLADWIAEQTSAGETALELAKTFDLLDGIEVTMSVAEHYEDGTSKTVDRATWRDGE